MTRSAWAGLLAVAVLLVLFVGTAPGAFDNTWTVNSLADPSPSPTETSCPSTCTLPDAIVAANNDGGTSEIAFGIGGGGAAQTIQLTQNLPQITAPVTIDGTTQLGPSATIPGITVLGGSGVTQGLDLEHGSDGSVIRGLALGGFSGTSTEAALVLASDSNTVAGNYVGVQADATTEADNQLGIFVTGSDNTIGGDTAADRNVAVNSSSLIGGTDADGILVEGNGATIVGNYVGLLPDGLTSARNEDSGIDVLDATNTHIGGPDPAEGNVVVRRTAHSRSCSATT